MIPAAKPEPPFADVTVKMALAELPKESVAVTVLAPEDGGTVKVALNEPEAPVERGLGMVVTPLPA